MLNQGTAEQEAFLGLWRFAGDLVDNWDRDTDSKDTHWTRIASDKAKIGGNCNFSVLGVCESEYALFSLLASHCAVAEGPQRLGKPTLL